MTICKTRIFRDYTKAIKRHKAVLMPFDCPSAAMGGEDLMTYNGLFRICACHFGTVRVAREAANLNMTEIGMAGLFIQTEINIFDSEGSSTCGLITPTSKT